MKKVFVILAVLMILPALAFAQLAVGPAAFFKSPVLLGQSVDADEVNVNQFSFGADARYRLGWFQVQGLMLYSVGDINSLDIFLDGGVALDVGIVTVSAGAGPNFTNNFDGSPAQQAGLNSRVGADVRLGPVSVGGSYIMALDITDNGFNIKTSSGLLGAHVLFWL
ncbi:MAG: hypothetical protein EA403_16865 [Spirochaetaceae bacterium]|nr:MAG: hypothetical protein EA403_16865 [Spirochaetaceae bacterium]